MTSSLSSPLAVLLLFSLRLSFQSKYMCIRVCVCVCVCVCVWPSDSLLSFLPGSLLRPSSVSASLHRVLPHSLRPLPPQPQGHAVWFSDLSLEAAEKAAEQSRSLGHAVAGALALDVSNADSVALMQQATQVRPVDVLVNNAGIQHVSRLEVRRPLLPAAAGPAFGGCWWICVPLCVVCVGAYCVCALAAVATRGPFVG